MLLYVNCWSENRAVPAIGPKGYSRHPFLPGRKSAHSQLLRDKVHPLFIYRQFFFHPGTLLEQPRVPALMEPCVKWQHCPYQGKHGNSLCNYWYKVIYTIYFTCYKLIRIRIYVQSITTVIRHEWCCVIKINIPFKLTKKKKKKQHWSRPSINI